jgi:hypothetical protein
MTLICAAMRNILLGTQTETQRNILAWPRCASYGKHRGREAALETWLCADMSLWLIGIDFVPHTGYTIHTVVDLTHAVLAPLERQQAIADGMQQWAASLSLAPETLLTYIDKSLPTAVGLAGAV